MRKVIFLIHMSLDGFVADSKGGMDWVVYNDEMEKYSHELHNTTDAAIYGRVTYLGMKSYWPTVLSEPSSTPGAIAHAQWLDRSTKIVVSKTLDSVDWGKTRLIHDNIGEEMAKIKQEPGKNLWLIGSPSLAQTFMQLGLIDEYRINLNPIILGSGQSLFGGLDKPPHLKLLDTTTFPGGVVALRYEPA